MDGVVMLVNDEMNVFAVETDNGFSVFEFVETEYIETGDVVSGALESAACNSLFNYSRVLSWRCTCATSYRRSRPLKPSYTLAE